jgi:hypothetical protein
MMEINFGLPHIAQWHNTPALIDFPKPLAEDEKISFTRLMAD